MLVEAIDCEDGILACCSRAIFFRVYVELLWKLKVWLRPCFDAFDGLQETVLFRLGQRT